MVGGGRKCVDLTVNSPKEREVANCIIARTDCGISNLLSTGTGVVEKILDGTFKPVWKEN